MSKLEKSVRDDQAAQRFLRGEITWHELVAEKRGYVEIERAAGPQFPRPLGGPLGFVGPAKYALIRSLTR